MPPPSRRPSSITTVRRCRTSGFSAPMASPILAFHKFPMGHFEGSKLRMWQWAKDFVLADNFFMGAFGGSFLNHQWLICACTPTFANAPEAMRTRLAPDGKLARRPGSPSAKDGAVQLVTP